MKWAWVVGAAGFAIIAVIAFRLARSPAELSVASAPTTPGASAHAEPTDEDMDELLFEQMTSAGLDLTKARPLAFALYFEEEREARGACDELAQEGTRVLLEGPPEPEAWWLCQATRDMVPTREGLRAARGQMKRVAAAWNGEYDGWEPASASPEQN